MFMGKSIMLSVETHEMLTEVCTKRESYDQVVKRLLNIYYGKMAEVEQ